ncbi:MAG: PEP-CTERM sorting domain-containing protein [Verrucomicrobiota bacterium]
MILLKAIMVAPVARHLRTALCGLAMAGIFAAPAAQGAILVIENFNDPGAQNFTTVGEGTTGPAPSDAFWDYGADQVTGLTGFEGDDFWGGRDLDATFGSPSGVPRILTTDPVDISLLLSPTLEISLAATEGVWESGDDDFLSIYVFDAATPGDRILLEQFLPDAASSGDLVATINGSQALGSSFATFVFTVPETISNLQIEIEASSTGALENLGIDNIQVEFIPEPQTAALLAAGFGLLLFRRRR